MGILIQLRNMDNNQVNYYGSYNDEFPINNIPTGTYEMEAFKQNYKRIVETVEITKDKKIHLEFELLDEFLDLKSRLSGKQYPTAISMDGRGFYGDQVEVPVAGEYVEVLGTRHPDDFGYTIYKIVTEGDVPTDNFSNRSSLKLTNHNLWAVPQYIDNFKPFENSTQNIEKMIRICETWLGKNNMFVYGSELTDNWLYQGLPTTDSNGQHEIVCSTFALIAMFGIEHTNSRFVDNIDNYSTGQWDLRKVFNSRPSRTVDSWLINDIVKLAEKFGWFFKVDDHYTNIKRGDILVQSQPLTDGWYPHYNVTHNVIYLGNNQVMQMSNADKNNPISINSISEFDMKNRTIGAIRFPLDSVNWNMNFK